MIFTLNIIMYQRKIILFYYWGFGGVLSTGILLVHFSMNIYYIYYNNVFIIKIKW